MEAALILARMEDQVQQAQEALADEDEGRFTTAVHLLQADALALSNLVRGW